MALECFTPKNLSPTLTQEIVHFLDSQSTSHPFQFPQWADSSTRFALLRQSNRILWFASCGTQFPLGTRLAGFRAFTINRGPVCDDREIWQSGLNDLVEHARDNGLVYLDAAPDWLQGTEPNALPAFKDWKRLGAGRVSLRLDLTKTPAELLARFRKNTRYEVHRAERAALVIGPATEQGYIEDFLSLYARLAERKGFSADSPHHLRGILSWLISEPSRGALLLARNGTSVAGGAVIVRSGKCCWYVWGASDRYDQFSVGHALQWHALLWAKSNGCTEYDFGGYTPGATSGPAWFKEGFGGRVVDFVPAQRYVLRRRPYMLFRILSRAG
jgi:peptidoglycan pentaglycine glycine transferase (the first glycine)